MGGYSSDDSGSPSGGGTKKQAKSFAKKNKTPVKDFIASGGVTGAVIRGVKKGIETAKKRRVNTKLIGTSDYQGDVEGKKSKIIDTIDHRDGNNQPQGIELAKASTTSATILGPAEIQKNAANTIGGPTSVEMTADEILLANKRKGRRSTILTTSSGLNESEEDEISKKTLLG